MNPTLEVRELSWQHLGPIAADREDLLALKLVEEAITPQTAEAAGRLNEGVIEKVLARRGTTESCWAPARSSDAPRSFPAAT